MECTRPSPHGVVILEFPSQEQVKDWYHSEDYPAARDAMAGECRTNYVRDGITAGEALHSMGTLAPEEQARMAASD